MVKAGARTIRFGDCELDLDRRELRRRGQPCHLTPRAFALLELLVEERPKALAKKALRDRLWPDTYVSNTALAQLVTGSLDPTPQVIASAVLLLAQHPDQLRRALAEPALVAGVVEEALRLAPPFMLIHRVVTDTHSRGAADLALGDHVALLIGAANRDPERFPDPDRFDPDREGNRHLSFGVGHHFCSGAGTVRLLARAAVAELLPLLSRSTLARDPEYAPSWASASSLRGRT